MLSQSGAEQAVAAQIYTADGVTAQTISNATPTVLAVASNGLSHQCVADAANDRITTTHAGLYHVDFQASFSSQHSAHTWEFRLRQNGSEVSKAACDRYMSSTDVGPVGFTATVQAAAGDHFTIYVEHNQGGSSDITIKQLQLVMHRLDRTG